MSIADLAAALIGLRESTNRDHQRVTGSVDELRATVTSLREETDERVDRRLAASAQSLRDLDRRLENDYERRYDAVLTALLEVTERLTQLAEGADGSADPAELSARLASLSAPRDRLRRIVEDAGIRQFTCEGEPYDPLRHEVVQREFVPDCTHEYVKTELRPGYVREGLDHTLVRAKVIVAAPPIMEGSADG
ncbi:MAG: nucleotide exchange factor GrpE [Armatimonadetes bacterium]|nr:nucleotide exchange factor GrpE [Armatimonadota bacterium]